jgi:hypothetical protein
MKEPIDNALRLLELLALDLERLYPAKSERGEQWREVLISECAEYRQRIANHLRYIQGRQFATVPPSVPASEVS